MISFTPWAILPDAERNFEGFSGKAKTSVI
jgi:hypothetical protein